MEYAEHILTANDLFSHFSTKSAGDKQTDTRPLHTPCYACTAQ